MPQTTPSTEIDAIIAALPDWRGKTLAHLRALIRQAVPDAIESFRMPAACDPRRSRPRSRAC